MDARVYHWKDKMEIIKFYAPCLFGIEGILSNELKHMGLHNVTAGNGSVVFEGSIDDVARCNIFLRTAERVCIVVGEFRAVTFDDLFEGVKRLRWERWIGRDDEFPVTGYSLNSTLHSVPDCQAIIKKAIVDRLTQHYGVRWFAESGPQHKIRFALFQDKVTVMLDTSGVGLHKRGYRPVSNMAPIRETLAAAIIDISRYRRVERFCDPMCGSGTFAIEAALFASNTAPGLGRQFAAEAWSQLPTHSFSNARMEAKDKISNISFEILGYDIDRKTVALAKENVKRAGFGGRVRIETADVKDLNLPEGKRNVIICNPPYGERMSDLHAVREQTRLIGRVFASQPNCRSYVISSSDTFEKDYGQKVRKKRKLYNGMIKTCLYQYFE